MSAVNTENTKWIQVTAFAVPLLAGLACLTSMPALLIHIRGGNIPVSILFTIVALQNTFRVVNAIIWSNADISSWWDGKILCDIEIKIIIGFDMASASCVVCIFRHLAIVLDSRNSGTTQTTKHQRLGLFIEMFLCVFTPCLIMALHYVVQPTRYLVYPIHGCSPVFDASWPSMVIMLFWPTICCIAATTYGIRAVIRMIKHRREVHILLANAQDKTNKKQFTRLFVLATIATLLLIPLLAFRAVSHPRYWYEYSWSRVHPPEWPQSIYLIPTFSVRMAVFDLIASILSFGLFIWFSLGHESTKMYKAIFKMLRLRKLRIKNTTIVSYQSDVAATGANTMKDSEEVELIFLDGDRQNGPMHPGRPLQELPSI